MFRRTHFLFVPFIVLVSFLISVFIFSCRQEAESSSLSFSLSSEAIEKIFNGGGRSNPKSSRELTDTADGSEYTLEISVYGDGVSVSESYIIRESDGKNPQVFTIDDLPSEISVSVNVSIFCNGELFWKTKEIPTILLYPGDNFIDVEMIKAGTALDNPDNPDPEKPDNPSITDAEYTVNHLVQKLSEDKSSVLNDYKEFETEKRSGKIGEETSASLKKYEGFTAQSFEQKTVNADGTTVVEIRYNRNSYKVVFDSNGGSGTVPEIETFYGAEFQIPENTFTAAAGYKASANTWKTLKDGSGGTYKAGEKASNLTSENGVAVTLFADWIEKSAHSITYYDSDGSIISRMSKTSFKENESVDLSNVSAEKQGYTFLGWSFTQGGSDRTTGWNAGEKTEDVLLYAIWTANTNTEYTVKHIFENVDGTYAENTGKTQTLSGTTGGTTNASALSGDDITGFTAQSVAQKTINADGSTVVEIKYERKTVTLTFNLENGSASPTTVSGKYGTSVSAPQNPTKTGYTFSGWKPTVPGTFPAEDATYTAQWEIAAISSWAELKTKIEEETSKDVFEATYKIGNINDFNNSQIYINGSNAQSSLSIVSTENVSVTGALDATSGIYFQIQNNGYTTIGSKNNSITFGSQTGTHSGAFIYVTDYANPSLFNCIFRNSNTKAVETSGTLLLENCQFQNISISGNSEGSIYVTGGTATVDSCVFTGCAGYNIYTKGTSNSGKVVLKGNLSDTSIYIENSDTAGVVTLDKDLSFAEGAKINVKIYKHSPGVAVFASSDGVAISETIRNRFTVTDEDGTGYIIDSDGVLVKEEPLITSWAELDSQIKAAPSDPGFNLFYRIGNISDFDNVSPIYISGNSTNDKISIVPGEKLSITVHSAEPDIHATFFDVSSITSTIGSESYSMTFGGDNITATSKFIKAGAMGKTTVASIVNCIFKNFKANSQEMEYSAIEVSGTTSLTLKNCNFIDIVADSSYAAVDITEGITTFDSCIFTNCTPDDISTSSDGKIVLQGTLYDTSIYIENSDTAEVVTLDTSLALNQNSKVNITIYQYLPDTKVFASSDGGAISETIRNYFTVTDDEGTGYTINADGTLALR